jgi:DNA-binding CsgD family transcriptional regulator
VETPNFRVATLTTGAPGSRNLEGMNSIATHTAPISGLLSLVTDALDHEPSRTGTPTGPIAPPQAPDLSAVLGQLAGGWMAVKEDGHGWMLLQFAPRTEPQPCGDRPSAPARPVPARPDFGARARRVHTALTEREREVLCLVAGGATNRAIAARLFISPKTASVHVSRILTKLNATTRTEAAALAHASGLVRPWGAVEGDLA